MAQSELYARPLEYGSAQSVVTRLQALPTMSRSSAILEIKAGQLAEHISASITNESLGSLTRVHTENGIISIDFGPQEMTHLRAALNSTLRLVQAGHDALEASRR